MGHTIAEKILGQHADGKPAKAGEIVVAGVDFAMIHDARAGNALKMIEKLGAKSLPHVKRTALVLDHYSPPPNMEAANTHVAMRAFADKHGSPLYDVGDGICHQVLPEGGHLTCGDLVVGTDTHSTTYGAFNAFGTGVEGTDVSAVMMTGKLWFRVPETIRIELKGPLQPGVWAKDVTLTMLGKLGAEGANYRALEYCGSGVSAMAIDDRMTLSNHAAELGAKAALLEADEKTFAWLKAHGAAAPKPVKADADAIYAQRIVIDTATLAPQVARQHNIDDVVAVPDVAGQKIHVALIGTCTNGRLDDLRAAAAVLKGRKIVVKGWVSPGSTAIKRQAEAEGLDRVFKEAGFEWRSSGCSSCVAMSGDTVPAGERCASTSNRNFEGRQGKGARTHLMSPAMVAAAAITGHLTDVRKLN